MCSTTGVGVLGAAHVQHLSSMCTTSFHHSFSLSIILLPLPCKWLERTAAEYLGWVRIWVCAKGGDRHCEQKQDTPVQVSNSELKLSSLSCISWRASLGKMKRLKLRCQRLKSLGSSKSPLIPCFQRAEIIQMLSSFSTERQTALNSFIQFHHVFFFKTRLQRRCLNEWQPEH